MLGFLGVCSCVSRLERDRRRLPKRGTCCAESMAKKLEPGRFRGLARILLQETPKCHYPAGAAAKFRPWRICAMIKAILGDQGLKWL